MTTASQQGLHQTQLYTTTASQQGLHQTQRYMTTASQQGLHQTQLYTTTASQHKKNIYVKTGCHLIMSLVVEISVQCYKMLVL
jgi:general stress protein 26